MSSVHEDAQVGVQKEASALSYEEIRVPIAAATQT